MGAGFLNQPWRRLIRYTIEYLTTVSAKAVVCGSAFSDSSLAATVLAARAGATSARTRHRANSFQIRDQLQGARIVVEEQFWGFSA